MFKIAWRDATGHTASVTTKDHGTFKKFVSDVHTTIVSNEKNKKLKAKGDAAWFIRGPADHRSNADLKSANVIIADIDDTTIKPKTCSLFLDELKIPHYIYTTSSHTEKSPRYRIIVPYKSNDDEGNKRATAYLQTKIPTIKFAAESYTYAQEWYLPINGAEEFYNEGEFKVPDDFDFEIKGVKDKDGIVKTQDGLDYDKHLKAIKEGKEIHPHSRGMCLALANGGLSSNMIFKVVWPEVKKACEERGIEDIQMRMESTQILADSAVYKREKESESEVNEVIEEKKIDTEIQDAKSLPWPPLMMGDLAKSVYKFQRYQDQTLAVMTAFCLVAGVSARRHNINDLGLAIYVTILADTGRGKDSIAKFINRTLIKASSLNGSKHIGAKGFTGAKALMLSLKENPCQVSVITEAAFNLRNRSGSPESLRKTILDVYTKTGQYDVAIGESYSEEKSSIPSVHAPNFTMINESTPKLFLEAMLANDGAEAGDYGRMFIFRIPSNKPYENENQEYKVPKRVLKRLTKLIEHNNAIEKDAEPKATMIDRPEDYIEFSRHCTDEENKAGPSDRMKSALYSRANEKRLRLIGLMCALENIKVPTSEIIKWATATIEHQADGLSKFSAGVSDDSIELAIGTIGKIMYEAIHDKRNNSRVKDGLNLRKNKIVSHGVIHKRCAKSLSHLDDDIIKSANAVSGKDKLINVLIHEGLIVEITPEKLLKFGVSQAKKSAYQMTTELYDELHEMFGGKK